MIALPIQPSSAKVVRRIRWAGRGSVFSPSDFLDLGSRDAVDQVLSRLVRTGVLRRLTRGLYDYPKTHPVLGVVAPAPETIAAALAGKHGIRFQPSGAYAANLLGLSTQVPAKIVFLTNGPSRTVRVGNQEIRLVRTTPRMMGPARRISGTVIQALRYLGQAQLDAAVIRSLRRKLRPAEKRQLLRDLPFAPAWVGAHLRAIAQAA